MVPMVPPVMNSAPIQKQQSQQTMQVAGTENDVSVLRLQGSNAATSIPTSPSHQKSDQAAQQGGATATKSSAIPELLSNNEEQPPCTNNSQSNLTNTKEKTPMCLINELARFNKIAHQYHLTSETGPAHKKRFTVTLKLGEEEYTAEGPSIKNAQHAAAADALSSTRYEHPPPKAQRVNRIRKINITPTVELNALAMKRGEPTSYTFLEPLPSPYPPNYFRNMSAYQRYHYNKPLFSPPTFFVSLRVGEREYNGQGRTAQAARHDAASKALQELQQLPVPEGVSETSVHKPAEENTDQQPQQQQQEPGSDLKSPISLVHEMALKRTLQVSFEVVQEKGPPHMRTFLTSCRVGETLTEGEGNSKKISKKRSAEKMLEELKKLPPVSPPALNPRRMKRKPTAVKKKTRNLIKEPKVKQEYADDINPISRLIQIQQARKEREPEYSLIEERGNPRRKEFVMEVTVGQLSCTGSGPNKKLAKRAAAEALLQSMGHSNRPNDSSNTNGSKSSGEQQSAASQGVSTSEKGRKVTFLEDCEAKESQGNGSTQQPGGSGGRQLVPGLLLMTDNSAFSGKGGTENGQVNSGPAHQAASVIAKELLNSGNSPTAEALVAAGHVPSASHPSSSVTTTTSSAQPARHKELLDYLSNLLKFSVSYTDFPKVKHSDYLSLVSLSTNPPVVCHGSGPSIDASHDQAARQALKALSDLGLDSVSSEVPASAEGIPTSGDNIHMISGSSKSVVTSNGK